MKEVIYNLDSEEYHNGEGYKDYLSSTQLKLYGKSPAAFKWAMENPQPKSEAMKFGSLFHLAMEICQAYGSMDKFNDAVAVFEAPTNPRTGKPYGIDTQKCAEAYDQFVADNEGKEIVSQETLSLLNAMINPLLSGQSSTSKMVCKLLKLSKTEVSHFLEVDGIKCKFRPDLESRLKIVDYKTVETDDLSERSINNIIAKYGYDISAAYYLFLEHEQSGIWKAFYWLFVSKKPPYDAVLVDSSGWTYEYDSQSGIAMPQVGAIKMKYLLDLHSKCTKENFWPGAEVNIPKDGYGKRIMRPTPPSWEVSAAANLLAQTYSK